MSISNFEILTQLGKGSFGAVYKVLRKTDNKIYAMKIVNIPNLSQKEINNSLNEIRILASIHNPHVVSYHEAFYSENTKTLHLIMDYLDDSDLENKIISYKKSNKQFLEKEIWKIFKQIVIGLKSLHDNKIIHRDLKSANIFLDKNGICKIGDMNVSKVIKNSILNNTQTGTPYYASPEIWNDKPYNFKTDIWSLGCILYEICTLKPPFIGKNFEDVYHKIISGKFKSINGIYSHSLRNVINNLLKVRSEERPNCDILLKWMDTMPIKSFFRDFDEEEIFNYGNSNIKSFFMMSTIKMPKQMKEINKILPKANYSNSSLNIFNNKKNDLVSNRNSQSAFCKSRFVRSNINKCNTGINNNNNNNNIYNNKQININNSSSIDSFDVEGNNNFKFNVNKIKNKVPKLPKINLKKKNFNIPFEKKDKKLLILDLNTKSKSLNKYNSGSNILKNINIKEDSIKEKENSPSQMQIKNLTRNFSSFNANSIINNPNNNSNGISEMIQFTEVESIKKINKLRKKKLQLHQRILSEVLNDNILNSNNNFNKFYNNKSLSEQNNEIILPNISNNNYGKFKKNYFNNISHESTEFSSNISNNNNYNYNNNINQINFLNQGNMRINNYNNNNIIGIIPE